MKTRVGGVRAGTQAFRDQVNAVTCWFRAWNECEQTVALYALLKKITVTQSKFLLHVLVQTVSQEAGSLGAADIQARERQANNAGTCPRTVLLADPLSWSSQCFETFVQKKNKG